MTMPVAKISAPALAAFAMACAAPSYAAPKHNGLQTKDLRSKRLARRIAKTRVAGPRRAAPPRRYDQLYSDGWGSGFGFNPGPYAAPSSLAAGAAGSPANRGDALRETIAIDVLTRRNGYVDGYPF